MASTVDTLAPGTVLADRYVIDEVVGIGGMGAVYAARDRRFRAVERICAVKEMFDTFNDTETRERAVKNFEREANLLASLNHKAIPKVFDFFTEGDCHYLVTEYVEGQDLARYIRQRARPVPVDRAIDWGIQICDVLTYLHTQDPPIIFRDLKPGNIMLRPNGQITLIDFGIAKHFQISRKGTIIGTEGYAPPEQYEGQATPQVDIYALGATLHHLLTNTDPQEYRPFSYASRPIEKHNRSAPRALIDVIMKALEDEPDERWQSAAEMRRAFQDASDHSSESDGRHVTEPVTRPATSLFDRLKKDSAPLETRGAPQQSPVRNQAPDGAGTTVTPRWTFRCEEEVRGTPYVHDGVVYVGSYDYNLYCLDAESGAFKWKFAAKGGITGQPAVWKHLVIFGSEDHRVYGINRHTGREAWTFTTQGRVRSSPRIAQDSLIIGSDDGCVYAIDPQKGRRVWKYETHAPVRSSACVCEQTVCIGSEDGTIYALDLVGGQVQWRVRTNGPVTSSPAIFQDRIICGSMDWMIYGLDVSSGWVVWRFRTNDRVVSSPFVHDERVLMGSVDGHVYCLEAEWGKQTWKRKIGAQVTSSPYVSDEKVYCGSTDGTLYCLEADHGRTLWSFQTDGPIPGSPYVEADTVYVGSMDHTVYALPASPSEYGPS